MTGRKNSSSLSSNDQHTGNDIESTLANPENGHRTAWLILGYNLAVVFPIIAYVVVCHFRFSMLDPADQTAANESYSTLLVRCQIAIMLFPFLSSLTSVTGLLWFGRPRDRRQDRDWKWDPAVKLIVAYVSRGNQPATLRNASFQTQLVLEKLKVDYSIEVVTDIDIASENRLERTDTKVLYYVVPGEYQTTRGARYKSRALQYLLEQRTGRLAGTETQNNVWILHMDEESILTEECVLGIQKHIDTYDLRRSEGAIGQGEILYNSTGYGDNTLVAAVDAARTGGDLGLFRVQYKAIHKPLVGMHGSFVLTPAAIEREITWDVGGHGSITEDSYFALMAMQRGVRFDWVEGFIREQSPYTLMDIVRQRRRWYCGLSHVARDPSLNFLTTLTLRVHVWFWTFSAFTLPLPLIYLQQKFVFGNGSLPYWPYLFAAVCTGLYASAYLVGAYRNVIHCSLPVFKKVWLVFSAVLAWFFFIPALVECAGTIYGALFPVTSFYVVAKDSKREQEPHESLEIPAAASGTA